MPTTSPSPTVIPMIAYEDASAALEWLAKAFGFRERTRITMPDGSIGHAEMEIGDDGIIMLAGSDQPAASLPHPQGLNVESGLNDGVAVPLPIIFRTVA